jgi:hypothetical protein
MSAVRHLPQPVLGRNSAFPRIPAITAVAGTSLIGFSAGTLGGPVAAMIFAVIGFLWGVLAFLLARRLTGSARRTMFANISLYTTTFAITCLTGVGLQIMPIMDVSITHAPQFFADLVRPPIGDAEALPYYLLNTPLEWLLIPAALLLNARIPERRTLIMIAATMFFALRVWSYLYFIPDILDWNQGTTGQPLSADQLKQATLWVDLSWIRLGVDATIALLLLSAAFIPAVNAGVLEPSSSKDASLVRS